MAGEASTGTIVNVPVVIFEVAPSLAPLVGVLDGAAGSRVPEKRPILLVIKHKQMSHKRFKYQKRASPELHT